MPRCPSRLGESPSAALVELEVDYPRFEFARTTVGTKWLMDDLHVHLRGGGGPVDHDDMSLGRIATTPALNLRVAIPISLGSSATVRAVVVRRALRHLLRLGPLHLAAGVHDESTGCFSNGTRVRILVKRSAGLSSVGI